MEIDIDAPWGEYRRLDVIGLFEQYVDQLEYFQKRNDTWKVREDIKGYKMILESDYPQENGQNFLALKHANRELIGKIRNTDVVKALKKAGRWK